MMAGLSLQGAALAPSPEGTEPPADTKPWVTFIPPATAPPPALQGAGTGTCRDTDLGARNGKHCRVLESALSLHSAFNICSPINLCLHAVNCAPAPIYIPQHCPHSSRGPGGPTASLGQQPKGRARGPPWAAPAPPALSSHSSPGPVTTSPACFVPNPSSHQTFTGLSLFFFCFNCFQNRFHVVPK